ncbi:hypothetical protein [Streptomyces sp. NPDC004284]|uniref:hypothetical protein n=1 Tax=Streptomyces sp. NPDC004284 TaxID=3364695 RepID=UPI00368F4767
MDLFDVEVGGGDEHHVGSGGGCSWVTVVLIGVAALLAFLMNRFFDLLGGIF